MGSAELEGKAGFEVDSGASRPASDLAALAGYVDLASQSRQLRPPESQHTRTHCEAPPAILDADLGCTTPLANIAKEGWESLDEREMSRASQKEIGRAHV